METASTWMWSNSNLQPAKKHVARLDWSSAGYKMEYDRPLEGEAAAQITGLLARWREGDAKAESLLVAAIYPVLQAMSCRQLAGSSPITLCSTEIVHESYIRLLGQRDLNFANRSHFYSIAAHVIRRVLVDHWRERGAQKRGGELAHVTLSVVDDFAAESQDEIGLLDIDRLLGRLEKISTRAARLVELRFFAGMSIEQAAAAMELSISTAKRDWKFARAWLHDQLRHRVENDE